MTDYFLIASFRTISTSSSSAVSWRTLVTETDGVPMLVGRSRYGSRAVARERQTRRVIDGAAKGNPASRHGAPHESVHIAF